MSFAILNKPLDRRSYEMCSCPTATCGAISLQWIPVGLYSIWQRAALKGSTTGANERPAQMGTEQGQNVQPKNGWHHGHHARLWQQEYVSVWVPQGRRWCCWAERGCLVIPSKTEFKTTGTLRMLPLWWRANAPHDAWGIRLSWDKMILNLRLYFTMCNSY